MERLSEQQRNALGRWYDRRLGKILPSDRLLGVLCCLLLNCLIYWGTQTVNAHRELVDITIELDKKIPFDPRWVFIYLGAFVFWVVNYILIARQERWYSILAGELGAKLVCGLFFLLLPSTNVRPALLGGGVSEKLLKLVYTLDAPTNLFPSIHCLESWLCFLGVRGRGEVPKWYQAFSCIFALLICISTLTTRQHVLADAVSGILLAQIFFMVSTRRNWGTSLKRAMEWADRRILGAKAR